MKRAFRKISVAIRKVPIDSCSYKWEIGLGKTDQIAMKTTIHLGARTSAATHEIVKLEAQNNYTLVHFIDGTKLLSSTTLGVLEERLSDYRFFRANRSTVINLNYLSRFTIHSYGAKTSTKTNNDIFISRRREAAFMACVNI